MKDISAPTAEGQIPLPPMATRITGLAVMISESQLHLLFEVTNISSDTKDK